MKVDVHGSKTKQNSKRLTGSQQKQILLLHHVQVTRPTPNYLQNKCT